MDAKTKSEKTWHEVAGMVRGRAPGSDLPAQAMAEYTSGPTRATSGFAMPGTSWPSGHVNTDVSSMDSGLGHVDIEAVRTALDDVFEEEEEVVE